MREGLSLLTCWGGIPKKFKIVAASAEGNYMLTAFDAALLKAGIGNVNLLRVSSILPPAAEQDQSLVFSPGALVPVAYASITSTKPGALIAAAVGIGFSADSFGVIMEFSDFCSRQEARKKIEEMLEEAFALRQMSMVKMLIESVEHKVIKTAAALAAVPMV